MLTIIQTAIGAIMLTTAFGPHVCALSYIFSVLWTFSSSLGTAPPHCCIPPLTALTRMAGPDTR